MTERGVVDARVGGGEEVRESTCHCGGKKKGGILPAAQLSWPPSLGTCARSGWRAGSTFRAGARALLENKGRRLTHLGRWF